MSRPPTEAPSRKIARELAEGVIADYERESKCGCLFHGRLRGLHRAPAAADRAPPGDADSNLLERLFVEERRRLKIIPNAFGEKAASS